MSEQSQRLFDDLVSGRRRALSRAISWVESQAPEADSLLERVYASAPHPWVIGITGVGGAGKSSLVPLLARCLARPAAPVAVLAVDPSSPLSGGALLGDRIRDASGEPHPDVFFRSVATRGGQGGLATCIADLVRVLAAAGFKTVLIETVGAGQAELGIMAVAHTLLLVAAPGLGDDIQAQKAGVMEMADVIVVNKADRPGAEDTQASLRQALLLSERSAHWHEGLNVQQSSDPHWHPPVLLSSALHGKGVQALGDSLRAHREFLDLAGRFDQLNRQHVRRRMDAYLQQLVQARVQALSERLGLEESLQARLELGQANPLAIARQLADRLMPCDAGPVADTPTDRQPLTFQRP